MNQFVRNRVEEAKERVLRSGTGIIHLTCSVDPETKRAADEARRELDEAVKQLDIVLDEFDKAGILTMPEPEDIIEKGSALSTGAPSLGTAIGEAIVNSAITLEALPRIIKLIDERFVQLDIITGNTKARLDKLEKQVKFEDCARVEGQKYIDGRLKELEEWSKAHMDTASDQGRYLDTVERRLLEFKNNFEGLKDNAQALTERTSELKQRLDVNQEKSIEKMANLAVKLEEHEKKLKEHADTNKKTLERVERLVAIFEYHTPKKGFWG